MNFTFTWSNFGQVIVMSSRPSLVLDACELLRSLLFPFELCAPYVPRLTEPFMSCLEFPGAIFVGIHDDGCAHGLAATVRKAPPEDSILVDLDSGNMDCSGNRYDRLRRCCDGSA
jgi:DENN (AEX-3) domain